MRVRPEQLKRALGKGLSPVYFVTGDETLIVQECMDMIRAECRKNGFDERKVLSVDKSFDWGILEEEASALSLFAERKIIELKLGSFKPGVPGAKAILAYLANPPEDNILLIESARMDKKALSSKWASTIDNAGNIIQVWPVSLAEMPKWITQRATDLGLSVEKDAITLLAERLEGNLLAAKQELDKLKLNFPEQSIGVEEVRASVEDSSRYDIFNLTDACLKGDTKQAIRILTHLKAEGVDATVCLWALSKELRLIEMLSTAAQQGQPPQSIFREQRVIQPRQGPLLNASRSLTAESIRAGLKACKICDDTIKGQNKGLSVWSALSEAVTLLCGKHLKLITR